MSNEVVAKNESTYLAGGVDLHELFSEEMSGLTPSFERIKIPAGGGIAFEVPGDDPNNPDLVKSFIISPSIPITRKNMTVRTIRLTAHRWTGK